MSPPDAGGSLATLDALVREASTLAGPATMEADRILQICNACRYCEGYCAVFPAMARRLVFPQADLHYLANLCHNCGACLHACQYAAPHAFAVNVPRTLARVRVDTYAQYAWPRPLGRLYECNGLALSVALAVGLALAIALAARGVPGGVGAAANATTGATSFYAVVPHGTMALLFGLVFGYAVLALGIAVSRFWRAVSPGDAGAAAAAEAGAAVLSLRFLGGGHGQGCNEADDAFSLARRRFHHLVFYGFLLCFASTSVATLYHYVLDRPAPYDWTTLPKLLGTTGGVALAIGCVGLARLNLHRDPQHGDPAQRPMGPRLPRTAVPGRRQRAGAGARPRQRVDAGAAVPAPRRRAGPVRDAALRQVRARRVPCRGAAEVGGRETPAGRPRARRRLSGARLSLPSAPAVRILVSYTFCVSVVD